MLCQFLEFLEFKSLVILFGSVTLIWQFAFISMVHGNIHDIYFMILILD